MSNPHFEEEMQDTLQALRDGPFREDYANFYKCEWNEAQLTRGYRDLIELEDSMSRRGDLLTFDATILSLTSGRAYLEFEDGVRNYFRGNHEGFVKFLYVVSKQYGYSLIAAFWLRHDREYLKLGESSYATICFDEFAKEFTDPSLNLGDLRRLIESRDPSLAQGAQ